jgi:cytidine deaminase
MGTCAETNAIGAMVAAGGKRVTAVVVVGDGKAPVTPCGGCRQRIAEFAAPGTPVIVADRDRVRAQYTLAELLPHGFGPENLQA